MIGKKAAIELSMTTIIVIVLSLALLILGFVLVRNIMCSSINTITQIGELTDNQIRDLFGAQSGEVQCIGERDTVPVYADKTNYLKCIVDAPAEADYKFSLEVNEKYSTIDVNKIEDWLVGGEEYTIVPGNKKSKDIGRLQIPNDAPVGDIALDLTVKKNGDNFEESLLKFKVSRTNFATSALC